MKGGTSVEGNYSTVDTRGGRPDPANLSKAKMLNYFGAYGEVADPRQDRGRLLRLGEEGHRGRRRGGAGGRTGVAGRPADFENAVMKCQIMKAKKPEPGMPNEIPLCAWADHSTVAAAMRTRPSRRRP